MEEIAEDAEEEEGHVNKVLRQLLAIIISCSSDILFTTYLFACIIVWPEGPVVSNLGNR